MESSIFPELGYMLTNTQQFFVPETHLRLQRLEQLCRAVVGTLSVDALASRQNMAVGDERAHARIPLSSVGEVVLDQHSPWEFVEGHGFPVAPTELNAFLV